jgi:hypothetical protein
MTTPRQFKANRSNARASTGPRSNAGKARAGGNARRHGLSIAVASDPAAAGAAEALARRIVGDGAAPAAMALARAFAEAQIDLDRVRKVRRHVLGRLVAYPDGGTVGEAERSELLRQLRRLERYEQRTLARRRRAIRAFDQAFVEAARRRA